MFEPIRPSPTIPSWVGVAVVMRRLLPRPSPDRWSAPTVSSVWIAVITFVAGDLDDPGSYERLRQVLGDARCPLFYLAIPPSLFGSVVRRLADAGLTPEARVMVEKPFGYDLESARELNRQMLTVLSEEQIYRI